MNTHHYLTDYHHIAKLIRQLKLLKKKIYNAQGRQERVKFAYIILKHYLYRELRNEEGLLVQSDLTENNFDTCFEMKDGDYVVRELFLMAQQDSDFANAIREQFGEEYYQRYTLKFSNEPFTHGALF